MANNIFAILQVAWKLPYHVCQWRCQWSEDSKQILLRLFNGLFFQDNLGKPEPEGLNKSGL